LLDNLAYSEVDQNNPQTSSGQTSGWSVAVATKTTTTLVLTFTLTVKTCIGTVGLNVALVSHPLIDVGIYSIDTSSSGIIKVI
jgi:hypothetical protein